MALNIHSIEIVAILLTCSNLIWWSFLYCGYRKKRNEVKRGNGPFSLIIPAHNERQNLERLVPKLLEIEGVLEGEIIVVDDRSTDGSSEFLNRKQEEIAGFRVIGVTDLTEGVNPKKKALELGIQEAQSDQLILLDADCRPLSKSWLEYLLGALENNDIVMGFSGYSKKAGILNLAIQWDTFITGLQMSGWYGWGLTYMGLGRNLAYKKSVFEELDGFGKFRKQTGGDDDLFIQKAASARKTIKLIYGQETQTISEPENTWKDWFFQKRRHLNAGKSYFFGTFLQASMLITNYLYYIGICSLLLFTQAYGWIIAIISIRSLLAWKVFQTSKKDFGVQLGFFHAFLIEPIYLLWHFAVGLFSILTPDPKWQRNDRSRQRL